MRRKTWAWIGLAALFLVDGALITTAVENSFDRFQDNKSADSNPSDNEHKSFWQRTTDDPVAAYTLVLTFATVVSAWSTFYLWRVTVKLVTGAEDTAQRQLRAYIACDDAFFIKNSEASDAHFHVKFINVGQTPAKNVTITGKVIVYKNQVLFEENFVHDPNTIRVMTLGILDPKLEQFFRHIPTNRFVAENVLSGNTVTIRIQMNIIYSDVFDFRHRRSVTYEAFSIPPVSSLGPAYKFSMTLIESEEIALSAGNAAI